MPLPALPHGERVQQARLCTCIYCTHNCTSVWSRNTWIIVHCFNQVLAYSQLVAHGIPSHSLQPDAKNQALLFNMIADNFVALLHSMMDKYKDEIFMVYSVTCTYMYSGVHVRVLPRKIC